MPNTSTAAGNVRLTAWRSAVALLASALLCLVAGCGAEGPVPPPPVPTVEVDDLSIAVPGYVDPSDSGYWQSVIEAAPQVRDVIVNADSGPGAVVHEPYVQLIGSLRDAGVRVLGYVSTGWGERDPKSVYSEIDRWREWYGVDNIFLDEAASVPEEVGTYADYAATVHKAGGIVVLNPGLIPDRGYFEYADAIVTFEDSANNYFATRTPQGWLQAETNTEVWHIVIGAPRDQLSGVVDRARQHGADKIYVTDDVAPNPYDRLPRYWSGQLDAATQ